MGTDDRSSTGSLIQHLLDQPQTFNFFQAISLLEAQVLREGNGAVDDRLRLRSAISLAFQPSDIHAVEVRDEGERCFTLWTTVMGLAGSGGPLPLPFTELLLERAAKRDHASAEFLDIFNQRFLQFLYWSRKRGRPGLRINPFEGVVSKVLDSIGSLGISASAPQSYLWPRHAGLLAAPTRSMTGLVALLRDRTGLCIHGRQFVGQWLSMERACVAHLNGSQRLDGSCVLGQRVWDQAAGIALEVRVDCVQLLHSCLPGGQTYQLLRSLVATYVRQELSVTLVLVSFNKAFTAPILRNRSTMRLGWTTRLASTTAAPAAVRLKLDIHDV